MTDDMKYTVFYTDENGQLVPNGEKLLSITEIAKYRNIPTERLRYYDKIGLLRPDYVDKLTGRRFYSAQQCEKLKFIRELNNTDFKLDDPVIKELPERYALKGESNKFRTNLTGIEFMKLEEAIGGTSPVLATDKVAMTIKNSVDPDDMDSEVCPMVFCSADQADKESFTTVAGGKYVCAFHRNCYSYFGELIMKMRCLAQEHGYTLGSVGVMIYRIDITLTDNSDETIAELQFPLIKESREK